MYSAFHLLEMSSLRGTLILLACFGLTRLVKQCALRHSIWVLTLGIVLILPLITWMGPSWLLPILPTAPQLDESAPKMLSDGLATQTPAYSERPNDSTTAFHTQDDYSAFRSRAVDGPYSRQTLNFDIATVLLFIWCFGLVVVVAFYTRQARQLQQILRSSSVLNDSYWLNMLEACSARLGVHRPVRLAISDHVSIPIAFGIFQPTILLPRAASN